MDTRDNPLQSLFWRDEILQILYWLRGEGLDSTTTARDLAVFLDAGEPLVQQYLERLVEDGYAVSPDEYPRRYRLTEMGVKEGGRRFADEFAGLTGQAHGECTDPNCACRTLGPEACESHTGHLQ
jgi:hypothetical protein